MAAEAFDLTAAVRAFAGTRFRSLTWRSRADITRFQEQRIALWLRRSVWTVPACGDYRGQPLAALPVIDKAVLMANFDRFNRLGMAAEEGWAHFRGHTAPPGHFVGASTGTSGNRGLYLISAAERAAWLGTMLAKTLPAFPFTSARVAIVLPQNAALYRQPGRGTLLSLKFFDLNDGFAALPGRLAAYRPDTLVAPPKVLRWLAETGPDLPVRRIFSGAEVMDAPDRAAIRAGFGLEPGEIYMATEGLMGVTCSAGRLHLAEDVMHFDFEPGPAGSGLVSPVISDFSRHAQVMARYRMNDLLRLSPAPCRCGSPMLAVDEIVGRDDDVLLLPARGGAGCRMVTPDVIRNAILDLSPAITDFRCEQTGPSQVSVRLPMVVGTEIAEACAARLTALFRDQGVAAEIAVTLAVLEPPLDKLRRVRRIVREDPSCG